MSYFIDPWTVNTFVVPTSTTSIGVALWGAGGATMQVRTEGGALALCRVSMVTVLGDQVGLGPGALTRDVPCDRAAGAPLCRRWCLCDGHSACYSR
jgi:hypothetical protein